MKFIVIGLGLFGSALAAKLTRYGNEVIGVDSQMSKVEALKELDQYKPLVTYDNIAELKKIKEYCP